MLQWMDKPAAMAHACHVSAGDVHLWHSLPAKPEGALLTAAERILQCTVLENKDYTALYAAIHTLCLLQYSL